MYTSQNGLTLLHGSLEPIVKNVDFLDELENLLGNLTQIGTFEQHVILGSSITDIWRVSRQRMEAKAKSRQLAKREKTRKKRKGAPKQMLGWYITFFQIFRKQGRRRVVRGIKSERSLV